MSGAVSTCDQDFVNSKGIARRPCLQMMAHNSRAMCNALALYPTKEQV